ncbi:MULTISPECIES: helix-turn-helix domain-containing protein [Nocardiaceae]|uniref:helix-turn-helix domain-containing protein n=1 Tax=Nocardiaceae TaxID=85025 RepID=UPI001E58DEA6|nr:helix-turn-helix domain-containing protein [Rhodococcus sp. 15-2388-1-1a]
MLTKDAQSSTPLLPTLRAFLSVDGRKTESAEILYVQRRTLYNRLARISNILGKSLDEPETRQRLLLAVKGLELLEGSAISLSRLSQGGAGSSAGAVPLR